MKVRTYVSVIILIICCGLLIGNITGQQQQATPQQQVQALQMQLDTAEELIGEQEIYAKGLERLVVQKQQVLNQQSQCIGSIIGFRATSVPIDSVLTSYGL